MFKDRYENFENDFNFYLFIFVSFYICIDYPKFNLWVNSTSHSNLRNFMN